MPYMSICLSEIMSCHPWTSRYPVPVYVPVYTSVVGCRGLSYDIPLGPASTGGNESNEIISSSTRSSSDIDRHQLFPHLRVYTQGCA